MDLDNLTMGQSAGILVCVIVGAWVVLTLMVLGVWKFVELVS